MTVTHRTQSQTSTQRDSWLEINLAALERNYNKIKDIIKTDIMAIVKADAYGHGATAICPILQSLNVKSFGVATVDEGIALRKAGIKLPILILGATPLWSYETCIQNKLSITIYSKEQLEQLKKFTSENKLKTAVQLKIDTGMNRLGMDYKEANNIINELLEDKYLVLEGIFSHLAHSKDYEFSKIQKERFDEVVEKHKNLKIPKHLANSHAAINYPEFRYDMVRTGIALYGQEFNFLEQLISLKGRITEIHQVKARESVSYDRTWTAKKDSVIATIPIGYADGIDWRLSNKIFGAYQSTKIKQVGNITMDQMMFDISDIKDAKVNDTITLLSKELPISHWAEILHTLTYELICRLKLRLPRIYTRD